MLTGGSWLLSDRSNKNLMQLGIVKLPSPAPEIFIGL